MESKKIYETQATKENFHVPNTNSIIRRNMPANGENYSFMLLLIYAIIRRGDWGCSELSFPRLLALIDL